MICWSIFIKHWKQYFTWKKKVTLPLLPNKIPHDFMDLTKNPLYFPICFLQQKMEPSTSSRRPKNPRKNQGPVRQHGLNLVKGICTGSQVRSWHFFFGENPPGCLLKGGETYVRVSNLSNVAVCLGPGNKKKIKTTPSPPKRRVETSITGGWCFPLRHIVDVGVSFSLCWQAYMGIDTSCPSQIEKDDTISTTNALGTPQNPQQLWPGTSQTLNLKCEVSKKDWTQRISINDTHL